MFSRFGTILACDGEMDRRAHDDSIYCASIALHGKNDYILLRNRLLHFALQI